MMIRHVLRFTALCLAAFAVSFVAAGEEAGTGDDTPSCGALPGTTKILDTHDETFLVFGEIHGTREAPRAFGAIVCEAAARGPVIVGIERPAPMTAVMQTYIDSAGSDEDRFSLLRGFFDGTEWGLSSQAFLDLFIRLRELREAGADIQMVGFKTEQPVGDASQTPYEKGLAMGLRRASTANPDARVLVLVGNLHARKEPYPALGDRPGFDPMVMHLPEEDVLTFDISHAGGDAHLCSAKGCGPHPVEGRPRHQTPGLYLYEGDTRYHGIWSIGPVTASPPIGTRYR